MPDICPPPSPLLRNDGTSFAVEPDYLLRRSQVIGCFPDGLDIAHTLPQHARPSNGTGLSVAWAPGALRVTHGREAAPVRELDGGRTGLGPGD